MTTETSGINKVFGWTAFNESYSGYFRPFKFQIDDPRAVQSVKLVKSHALEEDFRSRMRAIRSKEESAELQIRSTYK